MMDVWFTSDTHYDHVNVIKYCRRPFLKDAALGWIDGNLDVEAMNETMIERWNAVVRPHAQVYHLGDVMLGPGYTLLERLTKLRARLNGVITLILGNHDRSVNVYRNAGFDRVMRSAMLCNDPRVGLVHMRHHPPRINSGMFELCGHVHERWKRRDGVINVGVDQWGFAPVHFETLVAMPSEDSL